MEWRMSNEDVAVGDVFSFGFTDDIGHNETFYKVLERRGKTEAVIVKIGKKIVREDEHGHLEVKADPNKVIDDSFKVKAWITAEGETVLRDFGSALYKKYYYRGDTGHITDQMIIEGLKREAAKKDR